MKRTTGTNRRAHRLLALRRTVVTHIALHHQLHRRLHFGNSKRTGQNAIIAGNAARLASRLHDAILSSFDGIGGTDLRTRWRVAVHTNHRQRLRRFATIDILQVDHRVTLVRIALRTCLHARLAANATIGVNEKEFVGWNWHRV